MKKSSLIVITTLIGLVLVGLFLAVPWIAMRRWGEPGWLMGPGMMGRGFGYHMPFGGIGMILVWLIPLFILGLLITGAVASIVSLAQPRHSHSLTPPASPASPAESPSQRCPNCSREVEPDWVACPYCAASLRSQA